MTRLILVGLGDIAPPDLHRLVDAGGLPAAAKLIDTGTIAALDVAGQDPTSFWASMMTGVPASIHGIRDAFAARPDGGGVGPVGAGDWRSKPVWQVLADAGVASVAVSCPGTVPATAWPGVVVIDERYASAPPTVEGDWPLAPGCAAPDALRASVRPMRIDPADLDDAIRGPIPARTMAYALSVHAAAMALAAKDDWRFLAVTYPPLDGGDAGHTFYDIIVDHLLGVAGAGAGTDVMLVSTGGVLLAAGPFFSSDRIAHGVAPADVAATVLARFGLGIDGGVGRPIDGVVPGACRLVAVGMGAEEASLSPLPPPPGAVDALDQLAMRCSFRMGQEAAERGDHVAAMEHFGAVTCREPYAREPLLLLAQSAFLANDAAVCRTVATQLAADDPDGLWSRLVAGAAAALENNDEADAHLAAAAALAGDDVDAQSRLAAIALRRGRHDAARTHYAAVDQASGASPALRAAARAGMATMHESENRLVEAEAMLLASLGQRYFAPRVHRQLGRLRMRQGRWIEASAALRTAVRQAPDLSGAAAELGRALAQCGR